MPPFPSKKARFVTLYPRHLQTRRSQRNVLFLLLINPYFLSHNEDIPPPERHVTKQ